MTNITTKFFSKKVSESFINEISNNVYYFAAGRFLPWPDEDYPDVSVDTTHAINEFKRNILFGKRIKPDAIIGLLTRYFWTTGSFYAQYDDTDADLFDKQFYVLNSYNNVYKCLHNNYGARSTSEPTLVQTNRFTTADGYVWKYMYTVSSANNSKFSTSSYMPIEANSTVTAAASNGAIDILLITNPGSGYTGYVTGAIKSVVSNNIFSIESQDYVLAVDNFYYNTSGFYIYQGTGEGQLTSISNYVVNSSGHYVYTAESLNSPALDITSEFRISPQVAIIGDGTGAKAFSTVNTVSHYVDSITILNAGSNYSYANVSIITNPSYGSGATARAVMAPFGGHGSDIPTELGSKLIGLSVFFTGSEGNTIPIETTFRQGGIITAPFKYTTPAASLTFNAGSSVSNTNDTINFTNANTTFKTGDKVRYAVSSGNTAVSGLANGSYYFVNSANSTTIRLSTALDSAAINLTSGSSETGHTIYSTNTFSSNNFSAVTTLSISTGTYTFTQNEMIVGADTGARAYVGFANSSTAIVTMINGVFSANSTYGETIRGRSSSVSATINANGINNPDIAPMTFRVMHIDNIEYIQRSAVDNEQGYLIVTL